VAFGGVGHIRVNPPPSSYFYIETLGENHWGEHSIGLDTDSGLTISATQFICGNRWSYGGWARCLTGTTGGSVIGHRHTIMLLDTARSGRNILYVDDLQVPFELLISR
jgi:hypothetical protein